MADGRIAAGMPTPYPPGIPAALPGERLTKDVLRSVSPQLRCRSATVTPVDVS
ncbi:hypothetical protein ACFXPI_03400 [Streptomyces sp. NPDC059104]|uniref:Orn/Lys/Arg family decarboxylase n=1 Tax=Streptomyces sp. NPDC059104 TaxID=3346729 RepID=UPI0036BD19F0